MSKENRLVQFPKLKLPGALVKFAYRFIDIESVGEASTPDGRVIEYSFIISKLARLKPGRVLDVGCAARLNYLPASLAMLGWEVWGIDQREWQFEFPNFHFVLGDIRHTDFADGFFDCIYALSTLEHIGLAGRYGTSKDDLEADIKAISEISRILRKKGTLLITVPYGREYKVIRPLNRIYNRHRLMQLLNGWEVTGETLYAEDAKGLWIPVDEKMVHGFKEEDREVIALLEATL